MLIAGVDEAGRGPLAGPVVAAAVILGGAPPIEGIDDSKKLSAARRARLERGIREAALCWSVAMATPAEIDALNVHHATLLAMRRAVLGLSRRPDVALIDGRFTPELPVPARAEVGGDARIVVVAAASILAKQARDRFMRRLHDAYPRYGFAGHKGYPTRAHREALRAYGPCPHHRRSYAPVRECL